MTEKRNPTLRLIRKVDLMAEPLEAEADRMPQSRKVESDSYRKIAAILRQSEDPCTIRVWEEEEQEEK